eukprot:6492556-Prymnesium_polylepis.1
MPRASAVEVELVEELVVLGDGRVEPQHRHRAAELDLGHLAVAVLVPLAEEVDHAHRVLAQRGPLRAAVGRA